MLLHLVQGIWQLLQILLRFSVPQMLSPGESPTWQKQSDSQPLLFELLLNSQDFAYFIDRTLWHSFKGDVTVLILGKVKHQVKSLSHECTGRKWVPIQFWLTPRLPVILSFLSVSYFCTVCMCPVLFYKYLFAPTVPGNIYLVSSHGCTEEEVVVVHDNQEKDLCSKVTLEWSKTERRRTDDQAWQARSFLSHLLSSRTSVPKMLICKRPLDASVHLSTTCHWVVAVWSAFPGFLLDSEYRLRPYTWNREWLT